MKFEAILFDCDGVLVDSERLTHQVVVDMLAEHGVALGFDTLVGGRDAEVGETHGLAHKIGVGFSLAH